MGSDPSTMTFSEVFTALQQGTIDGQENPIDVISSSKLNEVQDYITVWTYSYDPLRSEEHTSELQSRGHLVCRLLLEKKKKTKKRKFSNQKNISTKRYR